MRTKVVAFLAMFAWCWIAGNTAVAQDSGLDAAKDQDQKKSAPSALEEMLAKALKNNPDIAVAEAKVRLAEAVLNRVQQAVLAKVVTLNNEIEVATEILRESEFRLERLKRIRDTAKGAVTDEEWGLALITRDKYKAELAGKKAELSLVIGKKTGAAGPGLPKSMAFSPDGKLLIESVEGGVRVWDVATGKLVDPKTSNLQPTTAEKLHAALQTPVKIDFRDASLADVLEYFQRHLKGVNLLLSTPEVPFTAKLTEPITLAAALQLIEDQTEIRFIIREYAIVGMDSKRLPAGAILLSEFVKHSQAKESKPKSE